MAIKIESKHKGFLTFDDIPVNDWFMDSEGNVYTKKPEFKYKQFSDVYNAMKFHNGVEFVEFCYLEDDFFVQKIDPEITIKF